MSNLSRRNLLCGSLLASLAPAPTWAQQAPATGTDRGGPPPAIGSLLPLPDFTLLDGQTLT